MLWLRLMECITKRFPATQLRPAHTCCNVDQASCLEADSCSGVRRLNQAAAAVLLLLLQSTTSNVTASSSSCNRPACSTACKPVREAAATLPRMLHASSCMQWSASRLLLLMSVALLLQGAPFPVAQLRPGLKHAAASSCCIKLALAAMGCRKLSHLLMRCRTVSVSLRCCCL